MRMIFILSLALLAATPSHAQTARGWTTSEAEGAAIATWSANAGGPELVSFACDAATREILVFRAAEPPLAAGLLVIRGTTGEVRTEAQPDPQGTPGMVARIPASDETIRAFSTSATLTISIGEPGTAEGLAVPVEQPLRDVLEGCAG